MRKMPAGLSDAGRACMPLGAKESIVSRLRDARIHLTLQSLIDDTASIRLDQTRR
jgi:hypothetical protein